MVVQDLTLYVAEESEYSSFAVVGAIHIFFLSVVIDSSMSCEMPIYHTGLLGLGYINASGFGSGSAGVKYGGLSVGFNSCLNNFSLYIIL